MSSKRKRRKARKLNDRLVEDAWEAAGRGEVTLGTKLVRRAIDRAPSNARYWFEQGAMLRVAGDPSGAVRSLRRAVELSPDYVEALRALAEIVGDRPEPPPPAPSPERAVVPDGRRTEGHAWDAVEEQLTRRACALLPALLTPEECRQLIDLDLGDAPFEHDVELERGTGEARYRFFRRPLPALVRELREELYWRVAPIANRWNERLGRDSTYPLLHPEFLARCAAEGQTRTTPLLFRYERGASNDLHCDVAGRVYFPLQLVVTLGPGNAADGGGGEFLLADSGTRKHARTVELRPGIGDGVLFCTRERLERVGGVFGLRTVRHGVAPLRARRRYALGVPFHDYRESSPT